MIFRSRRRLKELEGRVEGLECLLADLLDEWRTRSHRSDHSNGRGVLPETARRFSETRGKG